MGGNSNPKKRGLGYFLHKQYIAIEKYRKLHEREAERQRKLPKKAKVVK